jgi:hypothetical protein
MKNLARYELLVKQLWKDWNRFSFEQRNFQPSPNEWSIALVYEHLFKVEGNVKLAMEKHLQAKMIKKVKFSNKRNYFLLISALILPRKYKVPKNIPALSGDFDINLWESQLEEWKKFLNQIPKEHNKSLIFKHPYSGPLTPEMTAGFIYYHALHHLRQLYRIKKNPAFP